MVNQSEAEWIATGNIEAMSGQDEPHDIVATSKFKPSKASSSARLRQQQEDVVDDWDAESSDDEGHNVTANTKQADVFQASKEQWSEA